MIINPYGPGSRREQVERMFDGIAGTYDRVNRLSSLGTDQRWRRRLVRELTRERPDRVLDVATGTADLAVMAARAGARVTGIDISANMLDRGREKVKALGLEGRIDLQRADCEALPFQDGSFDAAMAAFGVRNFEHLDRGLREMHRVLRPGGRVLVLEFSRPRGPLAPLFRIYFHHVMPLIGRLMAHDQQAYTYLPRSVDAFPEGEGFLRILEGAGFVSTARWSLSGGIASLYLGRA